jgi:orotidine-5'-phosphate decarboxylase
MVRAAVDGFLLGARASAHPPPVLLGVTVLTSDAETGPDTFDRRVEVAVAAGCPGLVCSALDVARARVLHPAAVLVCPGIRPLHAGADDQARVATPSAAIRAGADVLVVGRPVTGAPDPTRAASLLADEVFAALDL